MPQLDFDVITLGHGSGGILTHKLLEAGVFRLFDNDQMAARHDGAIIQGQGRMAFTTDSFVVSPIFFPGGNIGDLAVNGTVNDLAMCGAVPQYMSLGFILEEGLRMEEFWEVLLAIKSAADAAGIQIVTGDTKVVERGKGDKIFINTTGVGSLHKDSDIHIGRVEPGDAVIVSGSIANHGVAILSKREGLSFESDVLSDSCPLHRPVLALLDQLGINVHLLRDPTRGGVATVLAEIAESSKLGIDIHEKAFRITEQVEGACELLGLDPMYVANEGLFVAILPENRTAEALSILKGFDQTRDASVVGKVTSAHGGQVVLESAIGGRRVIHMLPGEQLPRIC